MVSTPRMILPRKIGEKAWDQGKLEYKHRTAAEPEMITIDALMARLAQ